MPRNVARWIVGIATMAMFIAIISGVITHKKIFVEFFTFRPGKGQRSWLDFHNLSGVLALPFHIMITYSGLVLLGTLLLPTSFDGAPSAHHGGGPQQQEQRGAGRGAARVDTGQMLSGFGSAPAFLNIDTLLARAEHELGEPIAEIMVNNPGSADARITLSGAYNTSLLQAGYGNGLARSVSFAAASGAYLGLDEKTANSPVGATHTVVGGLHRATFARPLLRWLFFVSGLTGSVMIATGLVHWSIKRSEKRKGKPGGFGHRLVDVLNVGSIAGLTLAVAGYFWSNRLLPAALPGRAGWEVKCFFLVWLCAFIHPMLRPLKRAWIDQFVAAGLLLACLPVLDLMTSKASLAVTIPAKNWIVAGFDLTVCVLGLALLQIARQISSHRGRRSHGARVADAMPIQSSE
ncbi:hypothetical protein A6456_37425 [Paraburkholderia tropica]|nr:hypothetical protein A6456_37425 [Paraburkholderia tropica]